MSQPTGRGVGVLWYGPQQRQRPWQWLWRAVGWAVLAGGVVSAVINIFAAIYGYWIGFFGLWVIISTIVLVLWSLRLVPAPDREPGHLAAAPTHEGPGTEPFAVASWWQQRLTTTRDDVEWFDRVVRDRIIALVSERLRQRHGVSLSADPERARTVLGPRLHSFLTAPLPRTPTPGELESLILRMKEI